MKEVVVDGGPLSIEEVIGVAREGAPARLGKTAVSAMEASRKVVTSAVSGGATVYGLTTGFGALAQVRVPASELEGMQESLLRSHAAGVGDPLDDEIVRAMLLLRARTLAAGYSGVRPVLAERLLEALNAGLHPVVPEIGSVGASGDLAQLAHLALPLIGEGKARSNGEVRTGAEALAAAGLEPLRLSYKEGLSLLNGTEAMLAAGCLASVDADNLARTADVVCALSVEGLLGTDSGYDPRVHALRPHPGQVASAENLMRLLSGSPIVASHRDSDHAVQDAYSLRCAPQVHGACRDVLEFSRTVFGRELGSVTDNPLVFADSDEVLTAGNFHGEPLAFALDFMAIALAELGSISERRTDRMLDPAHSSGLPAFLTRTPGMSSGFMLAQYTQAALVVENRMLAAPASVDSIPTSGTQEDHVSMGWNSALKLRRVLRNVSFILGVEAMCAAQALDLRAPLQPAAGTRAAASTLRQMIPFLAEDRVLGDDIEMVASELIRSGALVKSVEAAIGALR